MYWGVSARLQVCVCVYIWNLQVFKRPGTWMVPPCENNGDALILLQVSLEKLWFRVSPLDVCVQQKQN